MTRITISDVAPELRMRVLLIPRPRFQNAVCRRFIRWITSRPPALKTESVGIETFTNEDGLELRIYRPAERLSRGALLWIHGGGYIIGHPAQNDGFCTATASELGIAIVAPRYRLAPEHPFPAGLDDCHAAWRWMQREAPGLDIDPMRVAIGGESAGGGLAAALVQRIHDEKGTPAAGQLLFCPMLDDRTAANRDLDAREHLLWNNAANAFGWEAYLGQEPGAKSAPPHAVPSRREDLGGLPPAWIGTSDLDLFHDEDAVYADRLRAAGVTVCFVDVPGAPHAFHASAPDAPLSRGFLSDAQGWLRSRLAEDDQISENSTSGRSSRVPR
jgi:acetyl esterase/lipase